MLAGLLAAALVAVFAQGRDVASAGQKVAAVLGVPREVVLAVCAFAGKRDFALRRQ